MDALAASRDAMRAIVAAGNAPTRELAVREVAYEDARVRAAELELELVATEERLRRLVGGPVGAVPPLSPAPATLELPEDVAAAAVAASLELRALDARVTAARRVTAAARVTGLAPDVDLFVDGERHDDGWSTTAGVGLTLPLLAFGAGDAARAAAVADGLAAERDRAEADVRSAGREARIRVVSAHRRAVHHQDVLVPARERVLHETLLH